MVIKSLKGHSGCSVFLCSHKKHPSKQFVRKISSSIAYNQRLLAQSKKQENFTSNIAIIKRPKILKSGYIDELFYFDMEYINGNLLCDHITTSDISTVMPYLEALKKYFACDKSINVDNYQLLVENKINEIKAKVSGYDQYYDYVLSNDWKKIPTNSCHGDFTLENLIVSNDKLYFIDFLDSFIETKLLDISKLLFDLRYFWSNRQLERKAIVKNIYIDSILSKTPVYKNNLDTVNCLIVLNILRIIPYCKEQNTVFFLERSLEHAIRQ